MKSSSPFFIIILNCLVFFLITGCLQSTKARPTIAVIRVETQDDFEKVSASIQESITSGCRRIVVSFKKGIYYFKDLHLYYTDMRLPGVSIVLKGNSSTIISGGEDFSNIGTAVKYIEGAGFIDAAGRDFQNYGKMYQSDAMVEVLDENSKLCRIHCSELGDVGRMDYSNAFIRITSWFTSFLYKVDRIFGGYVYFTANNLARGYAQYGNYNVNYDYTVGNILPRFRLINLPLGGCGIVSSMGGLLNRSSEKILHQCVAGRFVFLQNCEMKSVIIDGFNIIGGRADSQVIRFRNVEAESLIVRNTKISATRGIAIYGDDSDNITVENCEFYDNYKDVVNISNTCSNAIIRNNRFFNNGKGVMNSFCIVCRGGNYLISNNDISNFNYGAIGVGVWHGSAEGSRPCYGVVEKNHIYYTSDYIKEKADWTLLDGGAIYLWSKNDGTVIRNNFIHDYEGMGSNRGVYGDDGTSNCAIYGNIILNMGTGFSIDLRRSLTLDKLKIGLRSNENNTIYGNVFNNCFRFQGRGDDSTSIKGGNTVLVDNSSTVPSILEDNLVKKSRDKISVYNEEKWYEKGFSLIR